MLKALRSILFWCHLATGALVAAVVLLMSATGVLLTYQRQMIAWAETRGIDRAAPAAASARPLPVDTLLARLRGSGRDAPDSAPTAVTWRANAPRLAEIAFGRNRTLYVDRYSGNVVARSDAGVRAFFSRVTDWHRWLGAAGSDPAARARARVVTGAANLGFLFLVLSGFWLWWPRNWTQAAFRSAVFFRRGLRAKARDFNWHHVIGIWSLVPLLVIVASGVVLSYGWANALVYRSFGEAPPAPPASVGRPGESGATARPSTPPASVDTLLARAERKLPGWKSITLTIPRSAAAPVVFGIDRGNGAQPQKRATLTLDPLTGAERKWETFDTQTPGRRARSLLRFAHTGEVLGIAGQTIAGLVSLGAVLMVWTGLALSLRRLAAWRRRRSRGEAYATG